MNRVSIEVDVRLALRKFYATHIAYPVTGGHTPVGVEQVTGEIDGIPYGSFYEEGDLFTQPVGDGLLGTIHYVAQATPGDPTITIQREASPETRRPKVVLVDSIWNPELKQGASRVHMGIRSRPTARHGFVRSLYAGRVLHEDREHLITTKPFWRGGIWLHIEGIDRWEVSYVTGMANGRQQFRSDVYKLDIDVRPTRIDLSNLENAGTFKSVIAADVDAALSTATPLDQLPDGLPDDLAWDWTEIVGVSPVIEPAQEDDPLPRYAEKVGDYPLSTVADESGEAPFDMPPTE